MVETLGQYKILEPIGSGATGSVYRARDTRLGRTVAVRVLSATIAGDADRLARFLADARATLTLSHPNIAALFEIGEDQGLHFLACEFVAGQSIKSAITGHPFNPRRAIDLAMQIADALADAWAEGLVHGGLEGDHIIVTSKGHAKILDFGLARWKSGVAERATTDSSHQADIHALGLIFFEMLTGRAPVGVRTASAVKPGVPRELDAILLKALAKNPADRYQSAATLAAELRSVGAILDVRTEASEPAATGEPRRPWAILVWLAAVAGLAGIGWLVWMATRAQ
jgi:serine/threonine protein kinase